MFLRRCDARPGTRPATHRTVVAKNALLATTADMEIPEGVPDGTHPSNASRRAWRLSARLATLGVALPLILGLARPAHADWQITRHDSGTQTDKWNDADGTSRQDTQPWPFYLGATDGTATRYDTGEAGPGASHYIRTAGTFSFEFTWRTDSGTGLRPQRCG